MVNDNLIYSHYTKVKDGSLIQATNMASYNYKGMHNKTFSAVINIWAWKTSGFVTGNSHFDLCLIV